MRNFEVKRGATFQLTLAAANADGTAFDLSTLTVMGDIRDARDVLVAAISLMPVAGTPGIGTMTFDTTSWSLGLLKGDILISAGGVAAITRTFTINVLASVTYTTPAEAAFNPVTS